MVKGLPRSALAATDAKMRGLDWEPGSWWGGAGDYGEDYGIAW